MIYFVVNLLMLYLIYKFQLSFLQNALEFSQVYLNTLAAVCNSYTKTALDLHMAFIKPS